MKLTTLAMAAALTVGSVGVASANLLQNGDFANTHTPTSCGSGLFGSPLGCKSVDSGTPTQLNYQPQAFGPAYGEFLDGWTTTGPKSSSGTAVNAFGFRIQHVDWFPSAHAASHVDAADHDADTFSIGGRPLLPDSVTAPPNATTFIGMQSNLTNSGVEQEVNGLTPGDSYTLSFDWASTADAIDTDPSYPGQEHLNSKFGVKLGDSDRQYTSKESIIADPLGSGTQFSDWITESMDFVAHKTKETLNFLAIGGPSGIPPFALLTNVSLTPNSPPPPPPVSVPGPDTTLGLFGAGLFLLGLGFFVRRRRKTHHYEESIV